MNLSDHAVAQILSDNMNSYFEGIGMGELESLMFVLWEKTLCRVCRRRALSRLD